MHNTNEHLMFLKYSYELKQHCSVVEKVHMFKIITCISKKEKEINTYIKNDVEKIHIIQRKKRTINVKWARPKPPSTYI